MARPPRILVPNGIYMVTARGNRGQLVFTDEQEYRQYARFLREVASTHGWLCHSYCLTPDRVVLVVQTPVPNLSQGMQRLQTLYAQWFNRRHGLVGHLFDGRFRSALVEVGQLLETVRQVVAVPVLEGLVRRAADWTWSGVATTTRAHIPGFVSIHITLRLFRISPRWALGRLARVAGEGSARPPP